MARGRSAGLMAALGIHIGCYAHIIAAAVGLSALFHAIPMLFLAVTIAGALYLLWLGFMLFVAPSDVEADMPERVVKSGRRAFLKA